MDTDDNRHSDVPLTENPIVTEESSRDSELVDDSPVHEQPPVPEENLAPRRSSRIRTEPDRLNIQTWDRKTYTANYVVESSVWKSRGSHRRQPEQSTMKDLLPDVTCGGGGYLWVCPTHSKPCEVISTTGSCLFTDVEDCLGEKAF